MQTELTSGEDRLHRMESSIEELSARIARLAIALGVSLNNDDEVARVMHRHPLPAEAHTQHDGAELHIAHKWEELRGLLVLRYSVETRYVEQIGVVATRQILIESEEHLVREGFHLGDDGIDLDRLFKES